MDLDFYNWNANRAYPFVDPVAAPTGPEASGPIRHFPPGLYPGGLYPEGLYVDHDAVTGTASWAALKAVFLDAGFMMGPTAQFEVGGTHYVRLKRFKIDATATTIEVEWESNAPGLPAGTILTGAIGGSWPVGFAVELTPVVDSVAYPDLGVGWMAVNSSVEVFRYATGDWVDVDVAQGRVEPRCIQTLYDSMVTTLDLISEDSLDIDSNPSHTPEPIATGITGVITFAEGYNTEPFLESSANTIRILAAVGAGEGVPCDWIFPEDAVRCTDLIYILGGALPDDNGRIMLSGSGGVVAEVVGASEVELSVGNTNLFCEEEV